MGPSINYENNCQVQIVASSHLIVTVQVFVRSWVMTFPWLVLFYWQLVTTAPTRATTASTPCLHIHNAIFIYRPPTTNFTTNYNLNSATFLMSLSCTISMRQFIFHLLLHPSSMSCYVHPCLAQLVEMEVGWNSKY